MCHLPLLMPLLGLSVFWFWPVSTAVFAYLLILGLSGWLYYYVIKAMRRPVISGKEAVLHSSGEVIATDGDVLRVRVQNEIWNAESAEDLHPCDAIEVIGIKGLKLKVRHAGNAGKGQ